MVKQILNTKILITGGHLTPALSILEEFRARGYHNFVWIGVKYSQTFSIVKSAEYNEVRKYKIKFYSLNAGKLWMKWTRQTFFKALFNLIVIPLGFIQSFFILILERPAIVVSFGGYIALPVIFSAWILRIPSVTHEQTITTGFSNKLIAYFAKRIFVSWPESLKQFQKEKAILTGNPVRNFILRPPTNKINFDNNLPVIYFTGGNQGSNTINWRLFEILPRLLKEANVIHQTGHSTITNDFEKAKHLSDNLPTELADRYIYFDNIFGPLIGEIYNKADLVVSRAGANTVNEIAILNKFALLIPIPWSSHNEQQLNAEYLVKLGLAEILHQKDNMVPNELYDAIMHSLKIGIELKRKGGQKKGQDDKPSNASRLIIDEIEKLINN